MRIEAYNQVAQIYAANKTAKTTSTAKTSSAKDVFQMSSAGRDLQVAKQAVAEASDIREDKVADMKQKIEAGNYQVNTGDFASVLLAKYNNEL
ncbi:MAG: flagellar biosynthesis anti-sigma factor FlgM [Lachnospiraceae bacterium]|nr:flagellar biosynthesis anti-sigma factor FlgM [Lachnospiraceae bacterium]